MGNGEREDENRRLAEWLGWTLRSLRIDSGGDRDVWVPPSGDETQYQWEPPNFRTDEHWNAMLLEKMPDPVLWKGGPESPDWVCHPRHFRHGPQYDNLIRQDPDRKTAIVLAALALLNERGRG